MFEKDVTFYATKELSLAKRKLEMEAALSAIEAEAGAAVLDAEGAAAPVDPFDRVARASAEVRALGVAIAACRTRRLKAIEAARAGEVASLQKEAADKTHELQSIEGKTTKLLTQLEEIEGCEFVPGGRSKSSLLRAEVDQLERAARDIEQQAVPVSGVVDLTDVTSADAVLLAVGTYPTNGPTGEQVAAWLSACEDAAQQFCHVGFGESPRRVRLAWDADGIDVKQSYIFCMSLAKKTGDESIDVQSGTFRANIATVPSGRVPQAASETRTRDGFHYA